jgi:hypothetical protein
VKIATYATPSSASASVGQGCLGRGAEADGSILQKSRKGSLRLENADALASWLKDEQIPVVRHEQYWTARRMSRGESSLEVLVVCRVPALLDPYGRLDQPRGDRNPANEILPASR